MQYAGKSKDNIELCFLCFVAENFHTRYTTKWGNCAPQKQGFFAYSPTALFCFKLVQPVKQKTHNIGNKYKNNNKFNHFSYASRGSVKPSPNTSSVLVIIVKEASSASCAARRAL